MAFFEDLGKKISQTSQGVVQKTKDTAETIRLNSMITDEEKRIASITAEIGKRYFELHADSYEPAFEQFIMSIKEAQAKINSYSDQIKKIKGVLSCPHCGSDVPTGSQFCSSCGSRVTSPSAPTGRFCTRCGTPLASDVLFCTHCGAKVEAAGTAPAVDSEPAAEEPVVDAPVTDTPADETPAVRTCSACGVPLASDVLFCTHCGAKVGAAGTAPAVDSEPAAEEPVVDAPVTDTPADEAPAARICPACGCDNMVDSRFCIKCGSPLGG